MAVTPAHQIDVDVVVVIDVRTRRQHRAELIAGRGLHVAQKALLLRQPAPAVLDRDFASVGERERRDVERVAEGVLGNARPRIAVHAATGIGGNLFDLDNRRAEPAHRRRLHGAGDPAFELGYDRACERRRRAHRDRRERWRRRDVAGGTQRTRRRLARGRARGVARRARRVDQRPALVGLGREIIARRAHRGRRARFRRRRGGRHPVGSAKVVGLRRDRGLIDHARRVERHGLIGGGVTPRRLRRT